ncbi:unnamed protein product [Dicrocoelium dendriticum]|nr:unnamed protein product [Dicrocoelium dendriticum]
MNVRGFFKNVLYSEQVEGGEVPAPESGSGKAGFFSGPSKFLDSVQTKKNGLINEISNKFSSIKFSDEQPGGHIVGKKGENGARDADEGDNSSASEYGDEGDRPMYAEVTPVERRTSLESECSLPEEEADHIRQNVKNLIDCTFEMRELTPEMKANFENLLMSHTGRSAFARELRHRVRTKKHVSQSTLQELSELVNAALFHCNEKDDFAPAAHLMEACFTAYHESKAVNMDDHSQQHYLFTMLRNQPIWQSTRFWNAAFFIGLQSERKRLAIPPGKFIWRMYSLGIPRESCLDFLRKQASAEDLSKEKIRKLQENLRKFFQTQEENINAIRQEVRE